MTDFPQHDSIRTRLGATPSAWFGTRKSHPVLSPMMGAVRLRLSGLASRSGTALGTLRRVCTQDMGFAEADTALSAMTQLPPSRTEDPPQK